MVVCRGTGDVRGGFGLVEVEELDTLVDFGFELAQAVVRAAMEIIRGV